MNLLTKTTFTILLLILLSFKISFGNSDSITTLINSSTESDKYDLYLQLSTHFKESNTDSSYSYAIKALDIALTEEIAEDIVKSYFVLGKIQLRRDSIIPARDNFYKALFYLKGCDCKSINADVLMYLGKSYSVQDNYFEAIDYLMQSLQIAEEIQDELILSDLYDDIGLLLLILENNDQAMIYFEKAFVVNQKVQNKRNLATTLRNIGFILIQLKDYPTAKRKFVDAFSIYQDLEDDWGMATAKMGEGDVKFEMQDYDSALIIYKQASKVAENIDTRYKESGPLIQAYCYNRLGETNYKLGRYNSAISSLRKASDLAEEYTLPGRKADASKIFSQIYEKLGNMSMAYDYFRIYDQLSDSIINAKNVGKITKLEMEYHYLKKQKEREIEQIRKDSKYNRKVLFYEMMVIISVLLIVGLSSIFILYRKNQRNKVKRAELAKKNLELEKNNLQKELDFKNKELTTSVMYQLKKNNFIATISKKLKEINISPSAKHKTNLLQIVRELEANMSQESWEEFEYRFNSVHNDFYDNLLRDFPNLTPNELKLCAFLKLNMTSKDISTITYTTPQSITVARHRLRAKLGLSRDDNLITFLAKY